MAGKKIKLKDQIGRVVRVGGDATPGATVGRDLRWPDGTIVKLSEIKNPAVDGSIGGMAPTVWKLIREIPANIQKLAKLAGIGFTTRGADGEWYQRAIEAGEGIEVENADGVAGNPSVALADVPDVGGGTLQKTARDSYGRLAGTSAATTDDLSEGAANLYFTNGRADARITAQKGGANGLATLDAGAKIPANQLSALAITDTFVVASQSAMLALAAERGDVAVRTDLQKSFILTAEPAATLGNWQELLVPTGNPGTVTSVALSVPTGLVVAGSPITASGTFTVSYTAGYQGYTAAEASKLSGIASGATVGATWGVNLASIPTNISSWAGIAPESKADVSALSGKYDKTGGTVGGAGSGSDPVRIEGGNPTYVGVDVVNLDASATAISRLRFITSNKNVGFLAGASGTVGSDGFLVYDYTADSPIMYANVVSVSPGADNSRSSGLAHLRWSTVYAATGAINTSDGREKTPVRPLTSVEIAAAIELGGEIGAYQWLAMVERKGEAAREHIGLTVQRAIEILESQGLDPFRYGFICYDEWPELPEITGEDGEIVQERRPAGNRYSFRMDELLAFIARGLAHRLDAVEQRLAAAGL